MRRVTRGCCRSVNYGYVPASALVTADLAQSRVPCRVSNGFRHEGDERPACFAPLASIPSSVCPSGLSPAKRSGCRHLRSALRQPRTIRNRQAMPEPGIRRKRHLLAFQQATSGDEKWHHERGRVHRHVQSPAPRLSGALCLRRDGGRGPLHAAPYFCLLAGGRISTAIAWRMLRRIPA